MTLPLWLQLIALGVPVLVSVFSAIWATRSARRAQAAEHEAARLRALEDRVAQKKFELYQPFVKAIGDMLTPSRSEQTLANLEDVMADFQTFVSIWGSDEAVEAFFRYRVGSSKEPPSQISIRLMADFLLAVRRDVAWPDTKLTGIETIGMRINDLTDHPELMEAMTMPLDELAAKYNWELPFKV